MLLLDVSGSMDQPNKLPLLKRTMRMLVQRLDSRDRLAVVVYAGASGLVLPSITCEPGNRRRILEALDNLEAGGTTAGSEGIRLAYEVAGEGFIPGGTNRVILATDGDFNVGVTSQGDLTRLIEEKAKSGIFLTVLGFGMGNLKDSTMEKLADRGQRQLRLHRHHFRSAQGHGGTDDRHPDHHRQGREDTGGIQPGPGCGLPADRV